MRSGKVMGLRGTQMIKRGTESGFGKLAKATALGFVRRDDQTVAAESEATGLGFVKQDDMHI